MSVLSATPIRLPRAVLRMAPGVLLLAACAEPPRGVPPRGQAATRALAASAALADSSATALERRDLVAALRFADLRLARLARLLPAGDPALIEPLIRLGAVHRQCGQFGRAEAELREALSSAESTPVGPLVQADALHEMGLLCKDTGRGAEALALFDRAWRSLRRATAARPALAASVCRARGNWELRWGSVEKALAWYRRSVEIAERSPRLSAVEAAEAQTWLGFALLRAGRHDEAGPRFRRALALLPAGSADAPGARSAMDLLAVVEVGRGRLVAAESLLRRSTLLADAEAARQPRGFGFGVSHPSLRLGLMDLLLRRGRDEEAWEVGQVWAGWITDAIAIDSAGSGGAATVPGRAPVLPRLRRALAEDEAFVGWWDVHWDDDRERGGLHTLWGYVVRRDGPVHWVRLGEWRREREFRAWMRQLDDCQERIRAAAEWPVRVPSDPALDSLTTRLSGRLVAPLMPHLAGARRLVAVYQILNRWVPLECLRAPDGRELVERYDIAYAPSARAFVDLRGRPSRRRAGTGSALVVGDPAYSDAWGDASAASDTVVDWTRASASALEPTLIRGVLAGDRAVASLPRLAQSRAEARAVAARFPGSTLLMGREATASALERLRQDGRLRRYAVLHFATHALVEQSFPERSALALAPEHSPRASATASPGDGLLRAGTVYDAWRLDADLVTLSSCQTAAGRFTWSAQTLGLPQCFFHAGARSLLLSAWKVDDLATRALMEGFYARLAAASPGGPPATIEGHGPPARGLARGAALREAKLALRDFRAPDGSRPFAHPVYWAGFLLVGDPGGAAGEISARR